MSDRSAHLPPGVRASELTLSALHTAITARIWDLSHLEHVAEQTAGHLLIRAVEATGRPLSQPAVPTSIAPRSVWAEVGPLTA
ncbi:hypothetical protein AB0G05_33700 [Nonomuraea wenchangensis]